MKVKETATTNLPHKKNFTYRDLLDLPEDENRCEVINGELIMTPSPNVDHQTIVANIMDNLRTFVKKSHLGHVWCAPLDVILSETNVVEPDILFVATENAGIIGENNISGAPDLLVEILSPSSGYYDLVEKKDIYERFGIKEYWIVDPKKRWVESYFNKKGKFELLQRHDKEGVLVSKVLPGYQIAYATIFELIEK